MAGAGRDLRGLPVQRAGALLPQRSPRGAPVLVLKGVGSPLQRLLVYLITPELAQGG